MYMYIVHVACIAHVLAAGENEGLRIHVCLYIVYSHVNVYILLYK